MKEKNREYPKQAPALILVDIRAGACFGFRSFMLPFPSGLYIIKGKIDGCELECTQFMTFTGVQASGNGAIENCMDQDIYMIQNERIDEMSKVINKDFDEMLESQCTDGESVVL